MAGTTSEEDDKHSKVNFHQIKEDLHLYSKRNLESLSCVLIDAYHSTCATKEYVLKDYASWRIENETLEVLNKIL